MVRLFIDQCLQNDSRIALDEDASHYVKHVLRLKLGDQVTLFNGIEPLAEYQSRIVAINKKGVEVEIQSVTETDHESPLKIRLLQGISKNDRMDYTIQKAVELGVAEIYPLWVARCNVSLNDQQRLEKKINHWQKKTNSALEQSNRTSKVIVHAPVRLDEILTSNNANSDVNLLLQPESELRIREINLAQQPKTASLLVGPEGGFASSEVQKALEYGFQGIKLGPRILRTETAGVAVMAILQSLWGDL